MNHADTMAWWWADTTALHQLKAEATALVATSRVAEAFTLSSGHLTRSRTVAQLDQTNIHTKHRSLIADVTAELLRLPIVDLTTCPQTPARINYARHLVDFGWLLESTLEPYLAPGYVPDAAWNQLQRLSSHVGGWRHRRAFWDISLEPGNQLLAWVEDDDPPQTELLHVLNTLLVHGWEIASLEIRERDQDDPAGANTPWHAIQPRLFPELPSSSVLPDTVTAFRYQLRESLSQR